jgi:two-component system sensor histidine kinase KdpD
MAAADVRAIVLLPDREGKLLPSGNDARDFQLDTHDQAVAKWVYEHGQTAGRGTTTLPGSKGIYLPLSTSGGVVGVLGVIPLEEKTIDTGQIHLLEAFAGLIALALERANLEAEADQIRLDIETERMRNSLLSAVSHDLRTPLSAIIGAGSTLLENESTLETKSRHELIVSILDESERLNRLVANLLDMTRLQAGALVVHKQWQPVEEVIGAALARLSRQLVDHPVTTNITADLPFVPLDDLLIQQVLVNLLENAIRHTPTATPIDISARKEENFVVIEVADRGPGLPPDDLSRLFEKFYQAVNSQNRTGAGLGLAICRGIVQLHGGTIEANNRPGGGASFRFTLPIEGEPPAMPPQEAMLESDIAFDSNAKGAAT